MIFTGTDMENDLYQAVVNHKNLTRLLDAVQFGINRLSNPVLHQGQVRPDIKILLQEILVGVIFNILQRILHCNRKLIYL